MRLGVFIPPWGATAVGGEMATVATMAEDVGFASLWVGDHVVFPRMVGSTYLYNDSGVSPFDPDAPLIDPVTLLAWLAGQTSRIDLGISVLVLPIRNPVETAKHLADISVLSGGRLLVGVGAGWMKEEFAALDADHANRGRITDEWIAIFRHLWSGSPDGFTGDFYQFGPVGFEPRPPALPIIVGGNSRPALRRSARNDGWHGIRMPAEDVAANVETLRSMIDDSAYVERFSVVYRGSLPGMETAPGDGDSDKRLAAVRQTLESYRDAGVTEFIIEWPDASTSDRLAWMDWLANNDVLTSEGCLAAIDR